MLTLALCFASIILVGTLAAWIYDTLAAHRPKE